MDGFIRGFKALLAYLPYLVPALTFFSPILYSIGLFSPNMNTRSEVSQIIITPSTRLQYPDQNIARPDGPTVWFGIFGSCARAAKDMEIKCTPLRYNYYDLSVLPATAPAYVLQGPPLGSVVVGYIVLGIWPCLFGICSLVYIRAGLKCRKGMIENILLLSGLLPWVASLTCILGGINFWILKLYFDWTCDNFNDFVARQGPNGTQLIALRGDGVDWAEDSFLVFFAPWVYIMLDVFKQLENPPDDGKMTEEGPKADKDDKDKKDKAEEEKKEKEAKKEKEREAEESEEESENEKDPNYGAYAGGGYGAYAGGYGPYAGGYGPYAGGYGPYAGGGYGPYTERSYEASAEELARLLEILYLDPNIWNAEARDFFKINRKYFSLEIFPAGDPDLRTFLLAKLRDPDTWSYFRRILRPLYERPVREMPLDPNTGVGDWSESPDTPVTGNGLVMPERGKGKGRALA